MPSVFLGMVSGKHLSHTLGSERTVNDSDFNAYP